MSAASQKARRHGLPDGLYKFTNNRIWSVKSGRIEGTVHVGAARGGIDLEVLLDAVSADATGSPCGLSDCCAVVVGAGIARFNGSIADWVLAAGQDSRPVMLRAVDRSLADCLSLQYGLNEAEAIHALDSHGQGSTSLEEGECVVLTETGREMRVPAFPADCSYIRITVDGWELAYWDERELADAPAEVLGALVGALKGPTRL